MGKIIFSACTLQMSNTTTISNSMHPCVKDPFPLEKLATKIIPVTKYPEISTPSDKYSSEPISTGKNTKIKKISTEFYEP